MLEMMIFKIKKHMLLMNLKLIKNKKKALIFSSFLYFLFKKLKFKI